MQAVQPINSKLNYLFEQSLDIIMFSSVHFVLNYFCRNSELFENKQTGLKASIGHLLVLTKQRFLTTVPTIPY